MKDISKASLRRGHNEGNIRQRTDGRWEVRLSAGIDYKTGKPRRTSTCCNTRQEAIAVLQQQAHEVRTQGWRDPMSVTLGEWYEYWLDTYMKDTVKQSTYASYRSYLNKHFCVLGKILLKKLEPHTLQEFYNHKFREEGLSPKTLRNYHMALHKCLQQAVKEHLLVYNPCDAVTLPSGEKPEISVFTNDQQRALVQASYRHRYGVFIRLDLCTGLRMGELLALKWGDIDFSTAQLHVRRTINRLAKYEAHDGENKTEIVFGTPKTKNSRRTIPLTRTMADELTRWKQQQAQDKIRAGDKYTDDGFIVTNEFGHYFEQKTFKDYYDRLLKDADIGHFTFHALRHTFATRALERGMDYKTLSAILGHYSVQRHKHGIARPHHCVGNQRGQAVQHQNADGHDQVADDHERTEFSELAVRAVHQRTDDGVSDSVKQTHTGDHDGGKDHGQRQNLAAEGCNVGQHQNIVHVRGTVVQREQDQLIRLGAVDRAAVLVFIHKRFLPIV